MHNKNPLTRGEKKKFYMQCQTQKWDVARAQQIFFFLIIMNTQTWTSSSRLFSVMPNIVMFPWEVISIQSVAARLIQAEIFKNKNVTKTLLRHPEQAKQRSCTLYVQHLVWGWTVKSMCLQQPWRKKKRVDPRCVRGQVLCDGYNVEILTTKRCSRLWSWANNEPKIKREGRSHEAHYVGGGEAH